MNVFFLGNNRLGWRALRWLRERGERLVGMAIHPEENGKFREEILHAAALPADRVFDGATLDDPGVLHRVRSLEPDLGISVFFGYILRPAFFELFPRGCVNLHTSCLPYNRGMHPNVWSIVDGTPAGVTLHVVDAGVDTGAILAQDAVEVEPIDTGRSLYRKLEDAALALLAREWPALVAGTLVPRPCDSTEGTSHRRRDLATLDVIELDRTYKARELIDLIRARTFPPYPGAYFEVDGRRVYLRLDLQYGEDEET
jgi:methionyl-tRNA formyltransferase